MKYISMYYVTIVVLLIVAIVESSGHGFPVNLLVAVLTTSVLDVAIKRLWLKEAFRMPLSAIITGLIVGTVSVNAPVMGTFAGAVLAILSKFFIRLKDRHIFNPAVFGVVVSQLLSPAAHGPTTHGLSQAVENFGPGGFAVSLWLAPLLLYASFRANKLWISLPFLVATALLYPLTGLVKLNSLNIADIASFLEAMPYYFSFIIASEPKTTPYGIKEQAVFGVGIAVMSILPLLIFGFYSHVVTLVTLLAANLIYAVYRTTRS